MKLKDKKKFTIDASILIKTNKNLQLKKLEYPKIQNNQVLVKIYYTSICGSQLMEIKGKRGKDKYLPHLLGHEASGIVNEVGPNVSKFKKGDKVIAGWITTNSKKYSGFNFNLIGTKKIISAGPITTFSNYSLIYENRLIKKPKGLDLREAALYGCAVPTGAGMVLNQVKPNRNDTVLVLGLGAIGLSAIAALKCFKVRNIVAVDINNKRLKIAKKMGANIIMNFKKKNFQRELLGKFPHGFDKCIESAGKTKTIEYGFSSLKDKTGKLYFASHPDNKNFIKLKPHDLIRGREIYGSWGGNCKPDRDIPIIYKLFKKNKIDLKNLLSKDYSLKQINTAISDFKRGSVIRPIIKMQHKYSK